MITSYDKVLSTLEKLKISDVDKNMRQSNYLQFAVELDYKKNGKAKIILQLSNPALNMYVNEFLIFLYTAEEIKEMVAKKVVTEEFISSLILLSSKEIIIYRILLDNYIRNSEEGNAIISIDQLHHELRQKCFKYGSDKYDETTIKEYYTALIKLSLKNILVNFVNCKAKAFEQYNKRGKTSFYDSFLHLGVTYDELKKMPTSKEFKYSLGEFGKYLKNNRHYNSFLSSSIYHLNFNQIDTFNIAIYIGTIIYLNRKNKSKHSIYVRSILEAINKYNKNGLTMNKTYLEYIMELDSKKKVKAMNQLKKQIAFIFDELLNEDKIEKYTYSGKWTYKYILEKELKIDIVFKSE